MRFTIFPVFAGSALSVLLATGCASAPPQPEIASSAAQSAYASTYPDELQGAAKEMNDDRQDAHTLQTTFAQRANELKGPVDANVAVSIVDRADEAGRSQAYASRRRETEAVRAFWDDERAAVTGRVVSAAQTKVNDSKCENADVGGPIAYSLKEGVDRQLEKRQRAKNEAQVLVERYKTSLGQGATGQANATVMQKLADDVALASYVVNVALVEDHTRLTRLMSERSTVDTALQRTIDEEHAFQQEKGRTDAEKKASEDRITALNKSRSALGGAVVNAEVASRGLDDQIKAAQADYATALRALKDQLRQRQP